MYALLSSLGNKSGPFTFQTKKAQLDSWLQTLQDGISSAAKAVEHSIKHGQPLDFVDTRPVTDLLNEVGHGGLSTLNLSVPGKATSPAAFPWELQDSQSISACPLHSLDREPALSFQNRETD